MRLRTLLTFVALVVVLTCSLAFAQEKQQPENDAQVIDDFVLTRGVSFEEPGKKKQQQGSPSRPPRGNNSSSGSSGGIASTKPPRKLKPIKSGPSGKTGTGGGSEMAGMSADESDAQFVKAGGVLRSLALGYTILM
ncbi:MAG: hypothetical protein QOE95_2092, partial [Gaiellaceae bacterium]|nr:hypothetical protein [Gaiellaceae bacterium]